MEIHKGKHGPPHTIIRRNRQLIKTKKDAIDLRFGKRTLSTILLDDNSNDIITYDKLKL